MELKQTLKLQQKLIMTPQLQQAIQLLQLTRQELIELINAELMNNPLLEDDIQTEKNEEQVKTEKQSDANEMETTESVFKESGRESYEYTAFTGSAEEERRFESKREDSLYEYMLWQLNIENFSDEEKIIGKAIIGNIEEDGYLRTSTEEIAKQFNFSPEEVNRVLLKIQELEPPGVGARNLKECLLIQVKQRNINDPLVRDLIENCLEDIEQGKFDYISRKLNVSEERIKEAINILRSLNPKPGYSITPSDAIPIIPDVIVKKVGDDYDVSINEEGLPIFKINNHYYKLLNSEDTPPQIRNYLNEKKRAIDNLKQAIIKRNESILAVAKSIVKHQKEFFDKGIEYLKPLVLREIAEDVHLHESTVSRICKGKYMETHFGIFEMKRFFSSRVVLSDNSEVSGETIKLKIKELIENENPREPYTDAEIVEKLKAAGINIARRTVVKYREQMKIPPSRERKRL